jgi:hypothetical protein
MIHGPYNIKEYSISSSQKKDEKKELAVQAQRCGTE